MAQVQNNPNPIVDGAQLYISEIGSESRQLLRQVQSVDVSDESSVTLVTGPTGVLGKNQAAGGYSISITTRRAATVPEEVNWKRLKALQIPFRLDYQLLNGSRFQYQPCYVSSIGHSTGEDGSTTSTIACVAINETEIPV